MTIEFAQPRPTPAEERGANVPSGRIQPMPLAQLRHWVLTHRPALIEVRLVIVGFGLPLVVTWLQQGW
ncbi:hypothetical protein ACIBSW_12555 [Actinoplanes sp. NPDC049668]|uniref:hypothetical protein n=1 Tax=unclassified Actinoplanes TaxID=2626549 RepID=UPI0033AA1266